MNQQELIHESRRQWLLLASDSRDFIARVNAQAPPMRKRNILARWWVTRPARRILREANRYLASLERYEREAAQ